MTERGLTRVSASARMLGRGGLIALGVSVPISTAVDGVLTGLVVVAWLIAARFRETLQAIRENPVAALACVWFGVHVLGAFYSIGDAANVWGAIGKSAFFLLIPIAAVLVESPEDVRRAHYAFMAAIALTVILSWLRWMGAVPADAPLLKPAQYSASVVFKYHLTQNLLVAFGAFMFAVYARGAETRRLRNVFITASMLCVVTALVIGDGRIGQLVLMVLALYYGSWLHGRRGLVVALFTTAAVAAAAYSIPGSSFKTRSAIAVSEVQRWQPGGEVYGSSAGERLQYYRRSINIISEHPLLGVGTGGFKAADRDEAGRSGMKPTDNPHSEYLLRAVELGIIGVLLMLAIFGIQWRTAAHLADSGHTAMARGLALMYAVASFGTTMLTDHVEALLYVWMSALLFAGFTAHRSSRA